MLKKIEELRKRPKVVRDRYALIFSTLFTAIIAIIWVSTLPAQLGEAPEMSLEVDDESGGFSRAMGDMKDQLGSAFDGLQESLEGLEELSGTTTAETATSTEPAEDDRYELDIQGMLESAGQPASEETGTASTTTTDDVSSAEDGPEIILIGTTTSTSE